MFDQGRCAMIFIRSIGSDMIQLQHVCKTYGEGERAHHALRNVNLTINDGDVFGIIGASGAGKSTLVRCLNLLERPT